jgi:hypothetical protein
MSRSTEPFAPDEDDCGTACTPGGRPDAAARARTLAAHASSARLDLPGVDDPDDNGIIPAARYVETDGSVLMFLPPEVGSALLSAHDDVAAVLHLIDVAPVAVPHRVRAHSWIAGWLSVPTGSDAAEAAKHLEESGGDPSALTDDRGNCVVRLEVGEVLVDDLWGAQHVEPEEFAAARVDPLAAAEPELLQHLAAAHSAQLAALASVVDLPGGVENVAPVTLDQYGLRLRCWGRDGTTCDVRFDFEQPVRGPEGLGDALRQLLTPATRG